jgi:hypothetical protein
VNNFIKSGNIHPHPPESAPVSSNTSPIRGIGSILENEKFIPGGHFNKKMQIPGKLPNGKPMNI